MRLMKVWLASCLLWASSHVLALDLSSGYYAVYEKVTGSGRTLYIVPKLSILIVASEINIPIAFMPDVPGVTATIGSDGKFSVLSLNNYTANDMAALGATLSSYRLFGADFTGDGQQDLLLQGGGSLESAIITAGSGTPQLYYRFGTDLNSASVQLVFDDYNRDGRMDIRATGGNPAYYISGYGIFDKYNTWFQSYDSSMAGYTTGLVGAINGKFEVNEQGNATYSAQILAARGTAGVTPQISLEYSSGGSDGIAGPGLSVAGVPVISRCRQTLARDGAVSGISLGASDRFCLDGQRLILTSGAYGAPGSNYRTEIDSYAVVTAYDGTVGNPEYFTVRRKDGSLSYFGKGNHSAQKVADGSNLHLSWAISRFEDNVGNPIKYTYIDDSLGHRISRIDYAYGNDTTAAGASDTFIEFVYQNRPDPRTLYVAGYQMRRTQRLSVIRSVNTGVELRNYHLTYRAANLQRPQSYVEKFFECVGTQCLQPTSFTWAVSQNDYSLVTKVASTAGTSKMLLRNMDINGDRKADMIYMNTTAPYQMYYQIWNGSAYNAPVPLPSGLVTDGNSNWQILDYNNDGKQDLLVGSPSQNWKLFLGSAGGLVPYNGGTGDTGIAYTAEASVLDLNGDGLPDIASASGFRLMQRVAVNSSWTYQWGANQAFSISLSTPPGQTGTITSNTFTLIPGEIVDSNGDGKVELSGIVTTVASPGGTTRRHAVLSQNAAGVYTVVGWGDPIPGTANPRSVSIDLNNDGLVDLLTLSPDSASASTTWSWRYAMNTGAGFTAEAALGSESAFPDLRLIDYNRDGNPDLLYSSGSSFVVRLFDSQSRTFSQSPINTNFGFTGTDNDRYVFADVDGDGRIDALRSVIEGSVTNFYLYRSSDAGTTFNRITRIDNGLGNVTDIAYKSMTDGSVYTPSTTANAQLWPSGTAKPYPVFDLSSSNYVVSSVKTTAPTAGTQPGTVSYSATRSFSYRYSGAKLQAGGRGYLGFESVKITDNQNSAVTTTTYRQDFPFIGQMLSREVKTATQVAMQYNTQHTAAMEVPALNGTRYYQLYVDKTTELRRDPVNAAEIGYSETDITGIDNWGNVTATTTSMFGAGAHSVFLTRVVTQNTYGSTDWEKQFGRLTRAEVRHKRNCIDICADIVRTTDFTYYGSSDGNLRGLLKSETVEPGSGAELTTSYLYDAFGNKTRITRSALGSADRFVHTEYDADGRYPTVKSSEFDSGGGWTEHETERVTQRNAYGSPTLIQGLNGNDTSITYDDLGREISRADSTGLSVNKEYSKVGLVTGAAYKVVTNASTGASMTEYFDALGRSIAKWQAGFGQGSQIITETEYDKFGQVLRQSQPHYSDAAAFWAENTYDNFGRLVAQSIPASQSETSNGAAAATTITHDGLHITFTNALNQIRQEWRNAAGELIRVEDAVNGSVEYEYDAMGNATTTISRDQDDPQVLTRSFISYDALGRKSKMIDADKGTWFYQYNAFGDLTDQYKIMSEPKYIGDLAPAITAGVVQHTHMNYDRRGRMISRQDVREGNQEEGSANWVYDSAPNGLGQLAAESGGGLARTYSYDDKGRVSSTVTTIDDMPYVQSVTYDAVGRIETQLDGATNTSGIHNSYNGRGYLVAVADLDEPESPLYQVQNMDARGNVTTAVLGNGATSTWNYENRTGLLLNQTVTSGLYSLQNLSYTWDVLGNQRSRRDQGLISATGNTYRDLKQSFCYDDLNRLIKTHQGVLNGSCSMTAGDQDQQYDALGNITYKAGVGTYTYLNARPRLLESTGDGVTYSYDAVGNMIGDDSGRALNYSAFDKLEFVQKGDNIVAFAYGPDRALYKHFDFDVGSGQMVITTTVGNVERVEKPDGSYDMRRYIAGFALWTEHFDSNGNSLGLDKQYLHKDILGSTVLITDGSTAIKQQFAFNPWGERVDLADWQSVLPASTFLPVSSQRTSRGFTGHEMADAVGLIHMKGRMYDARLGRFVQADPFIKDAVDTQSFNRYAYVRNAPLHRIDPTGFIEEVIGWGTSYGNSWFPDIGFYGWGSPWSPGHSGSDLPQARYQALKNKQIQDLVQIVLDNISIAAINDECQSCQDSQTLENVMVTVHKLLTGTEVTGNKFSAGLAPIFYPGIVPMLVFPQSERQWDSLGFVKHYFTGNAGKIDLGDIGLGDEFRESQSVQDVTKGYIETVMAVAYDGYQNSSKGQSNVTWIPNLFSVGQSTVFMDVSCNYGNCSFEFKIKDWFIDPLDIGTIAHWLNQDWPTEIRGAVPYKIDYQWYEQRRY